MRKTHIAELFLKGNIEWLKKEKEYIERIYWELCKNLVGSYDEEKTLKAIEHEKKRLSIVNSYIEQLERTLSENVE